jgi:hypothetical protein
VDQAQLQQLLYNAAASQAFALGYRLGVGADNDLAAEATNAAASLVAIGDEAERDRQTQAAVRAFRLIVDTMIAVRPEAYVNRAADLASNVIGEDTLRLARFKLCPGLFPFC